MRDKKWPARRRFCESHRNLESRKVARNDQMTILLGFGAVLEDKGQRITRMEYIHAPPLFLCLVSFLSHFESWNLCSLVEVGTN